MKKISVWYNQAKARWKAQTPRVFRRVQWVCAFISAVAIGINKACNEAGAVLPDWWVEIYPYLVSASAALVAGYQFTQTYDKNGKPVVKSRKKKKSVKENTNTILDHDDF